MGSKNKIAEWVVSHLPRAEHFYDLFAGGCAISHCAILSRKWKKVHVNDINPVMPSLFIDAINGKFKDETRWIGHDEFFRLRRMPTWTYVLASVVDTAIPTHIVKTSNR